MRAQSFIESILQPPLTRGQRPELPGHVRHPLQLGKRDTALSPNAERWGKQPRRWRREDRRLEGPIFQLSSRGEGLVTASAVARCTARPSRRPSEISTPDSELSSGLAWGIDEAGDVGASWREANAHARASLWGSMGKKAGNSILTVVTQLAVLRFSATASASVSANVNFQLHA